MPPGFETRTRFDLTTAIENWRRELASQSNLTADNRRELEAHLRDALADLQRLGLNNEESFWLACRRSGFSFGVLLQQCFLDLSTHGLIAWLMPAQPQKIPQPS
jgi:hypothetical protein